MSAPNRIYIHTDAHDDTYYELSDCCDDEVDYIRADIHEAEIDALKAELALAKELLEDWRYAVTIPRTNCSCHISAPCNDCYEWGELRETASETKKLLGVPQ